MKIRKFNEAAEPIDIEYIRQCFIDLIEEGKADVKLINGAATINLKTQSMAADFGGVNKDRIGSGTYFERYVKSAEESIKAMKMAADSIARLADEYPDYRLSVYSMASSIYITISLS